MAWGADAPAPTPAPAPAPAHSQQAAAAGASGYAQPQWQPPSSLHNSNSSAAPNSAAASASASTSVAPTVPQQQQSAAAAVPTSAPQPPRPPSNLSKASVLSCAYVGNLMSPPIARVSFDTMQHLIIQKDAGNIRIVGGGLGEQRRNGLIVRFAGGAVGASDDAAAGPVTRGISGQLVSLTWHLESDDFFSPTPIDATSAVLSLTKGRSEEFAMQLAPLPANTASAAAQTPNPFVFSLDQGSIEELKPFCCGGPEEERAIMLWPSAAGGGGGGLTLVFVATFSNNGGVPVRRTVPIRF